MSQVLITQELFDNMSYDRETAGLNAATTTTDCDNADNQPTVLIVFAKGDINAALYHLNESLKSPFDRQAIATVLVQETIKDDFIEKLQNQLKSLPSNAVTTTEKFLEALGNAKRMNAQIITVGKQNKADYQPTIVCDFVHEQLSSSSSPSGVVTLHTFRTTKEAIALVNRETLKFVNVSIWHENHGCALELVVALKSNYFFINCQRMPVTILEEYINHGRNYILLEKSYQYATLQHDGLQKTFVYPFGVTFAN